MPFSTIEEAKIIYMGTPEISASVLEDLLAANFNIVAVISNEDKPVGRKAILEPTPVKKVALAHGIPVFQPHRIKSENDFLKSIPCDLIITMAYGQIVPQEVLDHPKYGCLNLHGSLLPSYRGAAPIQRAIIDGLNVTGVTLMEMVLKMDAGRIYAQKSCPILEKDNYTTLQKTIAKTASELAIESTLDYLNGKLPGVPQKEEEVTFAAKILPADEHIPLSLKAEQFLCYVRGLSETPGGYLLLDGKKLKIFAAEIKENGGSNKIGEIVSDRKGLFVQIDGAIISITDLQLEGKKRMDAKSFVNGVRDLVGKTLE